MKNTARLVIISRCFLTNNEKYVFQVNYRGQSHPVNNMNLAEILPDTDHYMTYEGSTTYPGCWETVTWIVMNKPIYISRQARQCINQLNFKWDCDRGLTNFSPFFLLKWAESVNQIFAVQVFYFLLYSSRNRFFRKLHYSLEKRRQV